MSRPPRPEPIAMIGKRTAKTDCDRVSPGIRRPQLGRARLEHSGGRNFPGSRFVSFSVEQLDAYVALWLIFLGVWILAAASTKRSVRRDSSTSRFVYGVLVPLGAFLVIQPSRFGPLNVRLLPDTRVVNLCGLTITAAALGFAIWARFTLGRNWSGTVTVKAGHELIRSGPYRFVRHPIYSGILAGLVGTSIGEGTLPSLIGVVIALYGLRMKWKTEERFMVEQFGAQYVQYQREVKSVIPGLL